MSPADHQSVLGTIVDQTIRPAAATVDRSGVFPRTALMALGNAGVLGLVSATDVGGLGGTLVDAAKVLRHIANACGSTAMVVLMHYAATAAIEAHGPRSVRAAIARGGHLSTLAFSEVGSRSHFWSPISTATAVEGGVSLDAQKSWVTAAGEVDSYVWSSRSVDGDGPMSLWLVPASADGVRVAGHFDGLGLRGNASRPLTGNSVIVPWTAMLGPDGAGLDIALREVLPWFLTGCAAFSLGLIDALLSDAVAHLSGTRLEHLGQTLAEQPTVRTEVARLSIRADEADTFLSDTLEALVTERDDATLRMLQVKVVAGEAAASIADGVLRLCGGAAFRKELGVERRFRDALAARVMAPTTEALHEFVGRVALGQPLFDEVRTR